MNRPPRSTEAPIVVGIIGAGNVLWAYLQVLDRLVPRGHALPGPVCARRLETWGELRSRRPALRLVATPQEVIESDVEAVVIITPPESHAELTRMALEHGKHVLVEKPMAATSAAARTLVDLAASRRLHLLVAPFVQLAPTLRVLWGKVKADEIGQIHSARGLYGNAGSTWAAWYHDGRIGPLAEVGIYNLKTLTTFLGPISEVMAAEAIAVRPRKIGKVEIENPGPDVSHVLLRHLSGALSSLVSSHAIQRYRRPGLELYGTEGSANLLGDDWDPKGFEIWRNEAGRWEEYEAIEGTWLWADGLAELVMALRQGRDLLADLAQDLHLLEVIEAAQMSAREGKAVAVFSRFQMLDLHPEEFDTGRGIQHLHDHTRPADEQ